MNVVFVESMMFSSRRLRYLREVDFFSLQEYLNDNPEAGVVIPGTGGLRKIRWGDSRRGKGKRSGLRVIYFWWQSVSRVYFMSLYDKGSREDISLEERRILSEMVRSIKGGGS